MVMILILIMVIMVVMVIMEGTDDDDDDEVHRWVGCLRQRKREESGEGWSVGG